MHDEPKRSEGLAVATIVAAALLALGLVCFAVIGVGWEYYASKRASQERAIRVMRQIEAREAAKAARAAEMSSKAIESKDDSTTSTTLDG